MGIPTGVSQKRKMGKEKSAKVVRNIPQCSRSVYLCRVVSSYLIREKMFNVKHNIYNSDKKL